MYKTLQFMYKTFYRALTIAEMVGLVWLEGNRTYAQPPHSHGGNDSRV